MAMALLCRRKGSFRYQLCGRLFSSSTAPSSSSPLPFISSSSRWAPVLQHRHVPLAMVMSTCLRVSERRFSAEATSYPTPAPPPGDFDDFPEAGDGDYDDEEGADEDPAPDPEDGALYSPSESEN